MFLCKRARPDIETVVSYLSIRTTNHDDSDWLKLLQMMGFLKGIRDDVLTLEAADVQILYWYIDTASAVHPDMKSNSGLIFTLYKGAIINSSRKHKVNSRSSTEAELNVTDEILSKIMRVKTFLKKSRF